MKCGRIFRTAVAILVLLAAVSCSKPFPVVTTGEIEGAIVPRDDSA